MLNELLQKISGEQDQKKNQLKQELNPHQMNVDSNQLDSNFGTNPQSQN
jgi:hypothetical protein